ncbi:MAG: acyl-CoA thioesterase [Myxococcota bacterium]
MNSPAPASPAAPYRFGPPTPTADPNRFALSVTTGLCVGPPQRQFMMGGVGLGAAIAAIEDVTRKPLLWASAQYLSIAQPGHDLEIEVETVVAGKSVSQVRARCLSRDKELIGISAAVGARKSPDDAQYTVAPEVPSPETLGPEPSETNDSSDLFTRIERRRVGDPAAEAAGKARMWVRPREKEPITASLLAVFADFLPGAIPLTRRSSSLDNTIRIVSREDTEWILIDSTIHVLADGFFHGEARLYAENGRLLAIASQSAGLPRRS